MYFYFIVACHIDIYFTHFISESAFCHFLVNKRIFIHSCSNTEFIWLRLTFSHGRRHGFESGETILPVERAREKEFDPHFLASGGQNIA